MAAAISAYAANVDVVTDFEVGGDHIQNTSGVSTATLISTAVITDGGSTIIHIGDGTEMVISGRTGIDAFWFV